MGGLELILLDVIRVSEGSSAEVLAPVAQVDGDGRLLALWLHGRSEHTQRAYRTDVTDFLSFVSKPLRTVTVGDVQAWMDTLERLAPASRARKISSVKSLFGFRHRLGYLPFDVGRVVKRPKLKDTLAERIRPKATSTSSSSPRISRRLAAAHRFRNNALTAITCCCASSTPLACASTRSLASPGATCANVATPAR